MKKSEESKAELISRADSSETGVFTHMVVWVTVIPLILYHGI